MTISRLRIQAALDRVLAGGIAGLLVGAVFAFGGATWWAPVLLAGLTFVLVLASLGRAAASGRWRVLKSPLAAIGVLVLGLAVVQSAPLPAGIAGRVSPKAHAVHSTGMLEHLAREDDPDVILPEPISGRSTLTIDRPATLRWLLGGMACLAIFCVSAHFADRLERLYLVWGSVVAAFLLNAAIALIQVAGQSGGLYAFIEPGKGPKWAPTVADALASPGETALRPVGHGRPTEHPWALPRPDRPHNLGTLMGGPGAHLALGSIGLPLALAVALQLMAPRGSRDGLWSRLSESGQASLLVLLYAATIAGSFLIGLLAGPLVAIPFGLAIALVGLPSLLGTGLRWKGLILTTLTLAALAGGAAIDVGPSGGVMSRVDLAGAKAVWADARAVLRDFPLMGAGLGSFPSIQPYYKDRDASSTTAMSSVLQWCAESGAAGVVLLAIACLWALVRMPGAIRRVGSADRALAFGLVGAAVCFAIVSAIHWTVELPAVALAAAAVAGTGDRWLAGGTDLFVERG